MRFLALASTALMLVGCHSEPLSPDRYAIGPASGAADTRLTFNPDQDYWPVWSQDGAAILYSFIQPGGSPHRCLGLLPANGGTDLWQLCDDRYGQADTSSGFSGYALGNTGRLIYVEASAQPDLGGFPLHPVLWLADTAAPFRRTALATLPVNAGNVVITWLTELTWIDSTSFLALGQQFGTFSQCQRCAQVDTTFDAAGVVVEGTIHRGVATMQPIDGTVGATDYSVAGGGTSIVFTMRDSLSLYRVPITGGSPSAVAAVAGARQQLVGVSCKGAVCIVGVDSLTLAEDIGDVTQYPAIGSGSGTIASVALESGTVQTVYHSATLVFTPVLSPVTGDVVVQLGGVWGHLQTYEPDLSDLHLLRGLIP